LVDTSVKPARGRGADLYKHDVGNEAFGGERVAVGICWVSDCGEIQNQKEEEKKVLMEEEIMQKVT
jgi:hypothetical protein